MYRTLLIDLVYQSIRSRCPSRRCCIWWALLEIRAEFMGGLLEAIFFLSFIVFFCIGGTFRDTLLFLTAMAFWFHTRAPTFRKVGLCGRRLFTSTSLRHLPRLRLNKSGAEVLESDTVPIHHGFGRQIIVSYFRSPTITPSHQVKSYVQVLFGLIVNGVRRSCDQNRR